VRAPRHGPALALTAVSYNLCHHLGSLPDGLGAAGRGTRVGDWLDLLVPVLVLGPALAAVVAGRADRATYVLFGLGAWLYVSGHGIHLAANSIWNVEPSSTAELWDEYVGHWLWYTGVALVAASLARGMARRPRSTHPLAWPLALATGATWATNAVGGQFTLAGLVLGSAAIGWGWRERDGLGVLWLAVGLVAVPLLGGAWVFGWDFD
jgi:hypothetical protein